MRNIKRKLEYKIYRFLFIIWKKLNRVLDKKHLKLTLQSFLSIYDILGQEEIIPFKYEVLVYSDTLEKDGLFKDEEHLANWGTSEMSIILNEAKQGFPL